MPNNIYECDKIELDYLKTAPYCYRSEVIIDTTPEAIFASFEDSVDWTVWGTPITKVEWTSPKPYQVGTTRTVYMWGGLTGYEEFLAWEPNKHMAFRFNQCSKDNVTAFLEDYRVEQLENGQCRVVWTVCMEPKGFGATMMKPFNPVMRWSFQWMLNRFKQFMENEGQRHLHTS